MNSNKSLIPGVIELGSGFAPEAYGPIVDKDTQVIPEEVREANSWAAALAEITPQAGVA